MHFFENKRGLGMVAGQLHGTDGVVVRAHSLLFQHDVSNSLNGHELCATAIPTCFPWAS